MKIGIIGRTDNLYNTALLLKRNGYHISFILTAKEAPEYTKTAEDFKDLAKEWGIEYIYSANIIREYDKLKDIDTDIAISINYPGIISKKIINLFSLGILNAHGGDLPRYRGNACQAWAIINGENKIGLCIHKMAENLDSGDIISREYMHINEKNKIGDIYNWMDSIIPNLFMDSIKKLNKNSKYILERQSTNPSDIFRCYPRLPEDGRIDWSKTNLEILRLINASNKPYSGAYCKYKKNKMIIWDSSIVKDNENFCGIPGQVSLIGNDFIEVICGKGKLKILQVEIDNKLTSPNLVITSLRQRLS